MARKTFHEELKHLQSQVLEMGRLVERNVAKAVQSLVQNDVDLADAVIAGDDPIDNYYLDIEEQAIAVTATQCPVAKDLRLLISILLISVHLERMGDLSLNIAKATKRIAKVEENARLPELLSEMDKMTRQVVNSSLEAFEKKDIELAKKLPVMDEPIDALFKDFLKELSKHAEDESLAAVSDMILASRYLERIADQAVDIGERICFMVSGEMKQLD